MAEKDKKRDPMPSPNATPEEIGERILGYTQSRRLLG